MRCLFFDCDSYRQDIVVHGLQHAGEAWEDKLARLRAALQEAGHGGMVVSELDEINWLLNIRGEGSSHNEVRMRILSSMSQCPLLDLNVSLRACITPRHSSPWPWSRTRRSCSGSTWTR